VLRISIKKYTFANCPIPPLQKYVNLKGLPLTKICRAWDVIDTTCTIFVFKNRLYLGEFEAEFKKSLASESEPQGVLLDEKTEGRNSRDTVPLKMIHL
jgi:hypothetical protein